MTKEQVFHCILSFNCFGCYYVGLQIENKEVFTKIKSETSIMKNIFNMCILTIIVFISMKLHVNILQK
jgi:hypothetical protein